MKKLTVKLLKKLSSLLLIAVGDAQACNADKKNYVLDMSTWHDSYVTGPCYVCMAGAVMAKTLNVGKISATPEYYSNNTRKALWAIDEMRLGSFVGAYELLFSPIAFKRLTARQRNVLLELDTELSTKFTSSVRNRLNHLSWKTYVEAANALKKVGL